MMLVMNKACPESALSEQKIEKAFDVWYPDLEKSLNGLQLEYNTNLENANDSNTSNSADNATNEESSSLLDELLELARDNQRLLRNLTYKDSSGAESNHQEFYINIYADAEKKKGKNNPVIEVSDNPVTPPDFNNYEVLSWDEPLS